MSTRAPTHDKLATMAADIAQLVDPIHTAIPCHLRQHRRRNQPCPGHITTHPPLLDQLRRAAEPGSHSGGPERRTVPASRPPVRLDAVDTLSAVYVALSGWVARLRQDGAGLEVPSGTDWHKTMLRHLVGAAPTLAPSIGDWLATDVAGWWHDAAVGSGWRPEDLRRLR